MSVPVAKTYRVWIDDTPTALTRNWVEVQLITPPSGEYRSDQIPVLEATFRAVIPTGLRPRINPKTRTRVRIEASTPAATSLPWCYIEKATPVVEQGDLYELHVVSEDARLHEPGNPTTTVVSWRDHVTLDTLVPAVLAQAGLTLDGVMPVAGVACDPVYEKRNLVQNPHASFGVDNPTPGQPEAWHGTQRGYNASPSEDPGNPWYVFQPTSGTIWWYCHPPRNYLSVEEGKTYIFALRVYPDSLLIGKTITMMMGLYLPHPVAVYRQRIETKAHTLTAASQWIWMTVTIPRGVTQIDVGCTIAGVPSSGQNAIGTNRAIVTEWNEGDDPAEWWTGNTPTSARYEYGWTGTQHQSQSVRYPRTPRALEVAYQEPGESLWSVVSPHLERMGWRIIPTQGQPGKWSVVATSVQRTPDWFNLLDVFEPHTYISVDITEDRTDSEWADAVVLQYLWTDGKQGQQEAWDRAGVASPSKVMRVELEQPYPGAGAASRYLAVAQKRGKTLTLVLPLDLYWRPDDTVATYSDAWLIDRIQFDADADTMTITATPI